MQVLATIAVLFTAQCMVQAVAIPSGRSEKDVDISPSVGAAHGKAVGHLFAIIRSAADPVKFDDAALIGNDHKRISKIILTGGCSGTPGHLTRLQLTYRDNLHTTSTAVVDHGTAQGSKNPQELALQTDEFITGLQLSTYKQSVGELGFSKWTRIGWLRFETSKNRSLECGAHLGDGLSPASSVDKRQYSRKPDPITIQGSRDQALLYFAGSAGDMLDMLTSHWIAKSAF